MLFADLFVFSVLCLLVLVTIHQVVYPLLDGTPLFPFFRKSTVREKIVEMEHELETVAEQERLKKIELELNSRKAELDKK